MKNRFTYQIVDSETKEVISSVDCNKYAEIKADLLSSKIACEKLFFNYAVHIYGAQKVNEIVNKFID